MTWIFVPSGSSTESIFSDSLLTSTEDVVDPQILPISVEEENLQEDHGMAMVDDEQSDYVIIDKEKDGKGVGPHGNVLAKSNIAPTQLAEGAAVKPHFCFAPFDDSRQSKNHISADGTNYCYLSVNDDMVELQYEIDLRRVKNFEIKHVRADGNSLFSAVASQVYGDSEMYDFTRQNCVSFMAHNQEHFSQLVTDDFSSYCTRKRNDEVYGEFAELHALAHAYSRIIHIYSYSTEPVNVVHPPCADNSVPIRLSYHVGNHYNSLVELPSEFPAGGQLQTGSPAKVTGNREHHADDQWINDINLDSSTANLIAAFLASETGAELSIGGSIVMSPGIHFNSIDLALSLGFDITEVAAAYRKYGDDGSSMLHHLFTNDTYEESAIQDMEPRPAAPAIY
uniref:ubiquitinyl hydrolase 1 n=1 Tax=Kalanchoe fedtschenkoi TaxID=63787 RepID=A0A7N0V0Z2_KALFE